MNRRDLIIWVALSFALGIWIGKAFGVPVFMTAGSGVLCALGSFFCFRMKGVRIAFFLALLAFSFAGMVRMELAETVWRANSHAMIGTEGIFHVITTDAGLLGDGYTRTPVSLVSVQFSDGEERELYGDAYLYVPEGEIPFPPDLRLYAKGELSDFRFYKNPGKPDWESRYRDENRIGRVYAKSASDVNQAGNADEFILTRIAYEIRETIREKFSPYVDAVRLPLLMTLLFGGNYTELPPGVLDSFTTTGLIHILSVSGSHMALLFGFLILMGKWLGIPDRWVMVLSLLAMVCYAALAGFVAPVVRAALMGALAALAILFGRSKEGILLLAATVFLMLFYDPYFLFDVSFQLSVLASAGLLLFYQKTAVWLKIRRVPDKLAEGSALAFAAQVLTVPVVLYDFHRFPVYFLFSNLFVAPLLEFVIILGLAASVVIFIFTPLAAGFLFLADYLLWAAIRINFCLSNLPGSVLYLGAMSREWMIFYYSVVLFWIAGLWKRKYIKASLLACAAGLILWGWIAKPSKLFLVPDLGTSRGAAIVTDAGTILYYKDGGIRGNAGGREMVSVLGYYGIFSADVLLLDMSGGVGNSSFALDIPIREISVRKEGANRAKDFLLSHAESKRSILSDESLILSDGTQILAQGSDIVITNGSDRFYFDGGQKNPISGIEKVCFWMGGSRPFLSGVNSDKMDVISSDHYIYTGGRGEAAGEDRDFFALHDLETADVGKDGMASFGLVRGKWVNLWP